jgi:hypothetical protein
MSNLYLQFVYFIRFLTPSQNEGTKSSRGSKILKALVKQKTKSMDTNKNKISENEEVISPEVRVGPAKKEKHSVSV